MPANTTMLHIRIDEDVKTRAAAALEGVGLTLSDAVRILLTRVANEGGLPPGLTVTEETHDQWFRRKVQEALDSDRPLIPHDEVMSDMRALIDAKRKARLDG
ncbi:type II toxin-antitoxin system antitoxin, RelB/DinJ family [Tabrizicola sp. TH137]|uniref:type II toxin-antitoxin system RelB family antitoxin n=1 Tax=Tabrizicola sp. TH137 TaxID=2067452 RepID=UPI000C79D1D2|nr:type II toxin-antitoxin system RelB/DinJ family antitoxin [Tabrizicola sp. TH137]PLL11012.1 type II toxin-antitoxin system antitoxin, RelB/DinJ family [Tabrizicola sp. TH137]